MFYGLSKFLKKILPKQLFYRSLIIVAAPIIIMQIIISIVFFPLIAFLLCIFLGKRLGDKFSQIISIKCF